MKKLIQTIHERWEYVANSLGLAPDMGTQYTDMRKAFYAGAGSLLIEMNNKLSQLPEDQAVMHFDEWAALATEFWDEEVKIYDASNTTN